LREAVNSFVGKTHRDDVHITDSLVPVAVALAFPVAVVLAIVLAVELAAAAAASDESACENCALPNTL
jgi:hypothetical protein